MFRTEKAFVVKKIKVKKHKTFLKTDYKIPQYTSKKILDESNLFLDWYLPKYVKGTKNRILKIKLKKIKFN